MPTTPDPLADEAPATPEETRNELLKDALRPFTPIRHIFVQKPPRSGKATRGEQRGSLLGKLVHLRQERALDAYLALLGVEPVLGDQPLAAEVWARTFGSRGAAIPTGSVSRVWSQLEEHGLIERVRRERRSLVRPRREDGGAKYERPGHGNEHHGKGSWPKEDFYLVLPHEYWLKQYNDRLSLTGKAMLLIALQSTGKKETFYLPYEMAPDWYGISEEACQDGLQSLRGEGLLLERSQKLKSVRAPAGFATRWHYSLQGPFSTRNREALQAKTKGEVRAKAKTLTKSTGTA